MDHLAQIFAVESVQVGNLLRVDHVQGLDYYLFEPGPGHGLGVDHAQLGKVALGDGPDGLDAVELARVGRRSEAFEVLSEEELRLGGCVGAGAVVEQNWLLDVVLEAVLDLLQEPAKVGGVGRPAQVPDWLSQVRRYGSKHCLRHPLIAKGCQARLIGSLPGLLFCDP